MADEGHLWTSICVTFLDKEKIVNKRSQSFIIVVTFVGTTSGTLLQSTRSPPNATWVCFSYTKDD